MSNDLKDIFKLITVLALLLLTTWLVVFFSNTDSEKRQLLFPNYKLSSWKKVSVQGIDYRLDASDGSPDFLQNQFPISKPQWQKIQNDLSRIIVLEELFQPNPSVESEFLLSNPTFSVSTKDSTHQFFLGKINTETGNFWVKEIAYDKKKYYLCRSEIYFEGFYQTDVEGDRLSFLRFQNYFVEPFKSWYGANFWSNVETLSLRTEKSILFQLDNKLRILIPISPPEVEINQEFLQNYINRINHWVPPIIKVSTKDEINSLTHRNNFMLEIKFKDKASVQLIITDTGLLWSDKNLFFPASPDFLNQLVILPDNFYQEKIASLEKKWNFLQKNPETQFQWVNLKTKKSLNQSFVSIQKNESWTHFFCFLVGCLKEEQKPLMKIKQLPVEGMTQWIKAADYKLSLQGENFYFTHSPYKLQVLTPLGYEFSFISRLKEIYPRESFKSSVQ